MYPQNKCYDHARECVTCHVHVSYPVVGGNWFLNQFKKTWMTVFTCTV